MKDKEEKQINKFHKTHPIKAESVLLLLLLLLYVSSIHCELYNRIANFK